MTDAISKTERGTLRVEVIFAVEFSIPNVLLDRSAKPCFDEVTVAAISSMRDAVASSANGPVSVVLKDKTLSGTLTAGGPGNVVFSADDPETGKVILT